MNTKDILTGIREALTRQELTAHIDLVETAIERDECDFGTVEWLKIERAIDEKNAEMGGRVFH